MSYDEYLISKAGGDEQDRRERQARDQEPATGCEAERRNRQALFLLENKWGCGVIDIGEMQRLLRGDGDCFCAPGNKHNVGV